MVLSVPQSHAAATLPLQTQEGAERQRCHKETDTQRGLTGGGKSTSEKHPLPLIKD